MTTAEELAADDAVQRLRNSVQSPRVQRFIYNMRNLREQRGLSTESMAELLLVESLREEGEGTPIISRSVLINLENRRRATLTIDEGLLIARVLKTTVGWLCDYDGPACTQCQDDPPDGFMCKVCKADGDVRFKPYVEPKEES